MEMLKLKRSQLEEKFVHCASIAYRGIRISLIHQYEGNDTSDLFRLIHDIIANGEETTEDNVFTQNDRLINRLSTFVPKRVVEAGMISTTLTKPLGFILKRHLEALVELRDISKKLHRRLSGQKGTDLYHTQALIRKTTISQPFVNSVKMELRELSNLIESQIVIMACIDKKLEEKNYFDEKVKLFFTKVVQTTWSLTAHYQRHSRSSIAVTPGSSSQREVLTTWADKDILQKPPGQTKAIKGCKIEPWPIKGNWDEYMQRVFRKPLDYDIFLASSIKKGETEWKDIPSNTSLEVPSSILDSHLSSAEQCYHQVSVWPGHSNFNNYMQHIYTRGVDYDIFLASSYKTKAVKNKSKGTWESISPDNQARFPREEIFRINTGGVEGNTLPISQRSNVYVRVIKPYQARNEAQLSLKVGQKLKQKTTASSDGLAYGWTRSSRISFKRVGFYPVDCVELL